MEVPTKINDNIITYFIINEITLYTMGAMIVGDPPISNKIVSNGSLFDGKPNKSL